MSNEIPPVSEWRILTSRYPGATFNAMRFSWRVDSIVGHIIPNRVLQTEVCNLINQIKNTYQTDTPPATQVRAGDDALGALAEEWGVSSTSFGSITLGQIQLVKPRSAQVELYPRTFRCSICGHFRYYEDPSKLKKLECPVCGGYLRQYSFIMRCKDCGELRELLPRYHNASRGFTIKCQKPHCSADAKLLIGSRGIIDAAWVCSNRHRTPLMVICPRCAKRAMTPTVVTAGYMRPLLLSVVYRDQNEDITFASPSYRLTDDNHQKKEDVKRINDYGIGDVLVLPDITAYTVTYGYRIAISPRESSGTSSYGPAQFFKERSGRSNLYNAFITETSGKGIVFIFNKKRIVSACLSEIIQNEKNIFDDDTIHSAQEFNKSLDTDDELNRAYLWLRSGSQNALAYSTANEGRRKAPLFQLLHSLEHALTYQMALRSGLDENSFVGKVMLSKCAVLIYENQDVEAGGIDYLITTNQVARVVAHAVKHVMDCSYMCSDGCVKCLYTRDPLCHPGMPGEEEAGGAYITANSMLSRRLLLRFWDFDLSIFIKEYAGPEIETDEEEVEWD